MDKEVGLSDSYKLTYLHPAMKCKFGEDILNMAIGAWVDYPTITTSLQKAFEQRHMVFREYLQGICRQRFKDASYKELNEGMVRLGQHMHGLVQSGHFSVKYIITAIMELGLSKSLYEAWLEHTAGDEDVPANSKLMEFLEKKIRSCTPRSAARVKTSQSKPAHTPTPVKKQYKSPVFHAQRDNQLMFIACNRDTHQLYQYPTFKGMGLEQKRQTAQTAQACFNCLTAGHSIRACASHRSCKICGQCHHTLLHREEARPAPVQPSHPPAAPPAVPALTTRTSEAKTTLFMTCQVVVAIQTGQLRARAIIDSASALFLVTSRVAAQLQSKKFRRSMNITGLQGTQVSSSKYCTNLCLSPLDNPSLQYKISPAIVDKITTELSTVASAGVRGSPKLWGIRLADPEFDRLGRIDLLLGVDIYLQLMLSGMISIPQEELQAVNHFRATHTREPDGLYVVSLPHRKPAVELGCSKDQATR